jgi:transcriptional regulator with XRE-family HTH domain
MVKRPLDNLLLGGRIKMKIIVEDTQNQGNTEGAPICKRGRSWSRECMIVDKFVSRSIRVRRIQLKLSQSFLAEKIGVSFQQIQKYEYGVNRISSARLYQIAEILDVNIGYFFQGIKGNDILASVKEDVYDSESNVADQKKIREVLDLVRVFKDIDDSTIRKTIITLCKGYSKHKTHKMDDALGEEVRSS